MLLNCGVGGLLRVPWTTRRSNQSILKVIIPGCSLEGLMVKLKLQYFGHLIWRADSFEKTLMLGKIEDRRKRRQQRMRWLDGITDSIVMSLRKLRAMAKDREAWSAAVFGVTKRWKRVSDWTELNWTVAGTAGPRIPEEMEGGEKCHLSYQVLLALFLFPLGVTDGDKVYICALKYLHGFRCYKYSVVEEETKVHWPPPAYSSPITNFYLPIQGFMSHEINHHISCRYFYPWVHNFVVNS